VGTTGATAGWVPASTTSGLYTDICPVAGSITVPCTNAVWLALASLQGPSAGLVAVSWNGVARPAAVSGLAALTATTTAARAGVFVVRRRRDFR
jgi:hypothetical protein